MSERDRRFFSADSLERAVLDAASHYGVAPEQLRYEPVDKRGMKRRKVVIRVDPDSPTQGAEKNEKESESPVRAAAPAARAERGAPGPARRGGDRTEDSPRPPAGEARSAETAPPKTAPPEAAAPEAAAPESDSPVAASTGRERGAERDASPRASAVPSSSAPSSSATATGALGVRLPAGVQEWFELLPEADAEERAAAQRWTTALLDLAGLELEPRVRQGEEQLEVNLEGPDAEWLADDDGEILLSMQHLLPRLMQSDLERLVSCRVDCGGFQLLREERLRARAHWAAEEVRSEGRAVTLEPMAPADRRIIHLALVHDATVETESQGRGYFKRVSVRPS